MADKVYLDADVENTIIMRFKNTVFTKYICMLCFFLPVFVIILFIVSGYLNIENPGNGVSNIWFIQNEYSYITERFGDKIRPSDMFLYELVIWTALFVNSMKLILILSNINLYDIYIIVHNKTKVKYSKMIFFGFICCTFNLYISLRYTLIINNNSIKYLLNKNGYTAFIPGLQAFLFSSSLSFIVEAVLVSFWLLSRNKCRSNINKY